ncbi:MAG: hypothetical protein A3H06_02550 [Candidatus Colwellbacteria bacterium RIFCSPLOWO2_12_FULL_44_13]|uniref:Uncharacterized protein n=1 Tax=Candidatus Colwellbacteria bacterium RIFCSPLOWO2_12_FULL_44_13 TaxID=1797694 RepID=A0A1G1Z9D2_9BACT|nr:MAG: hypothetical protein A3H06_02550 [Candidatus Colwellbacteria bacterium RIFCSPLOWO2_12_FULL_44_13]
MWFAVSIRTSSIPVIGHLLSEAISFLRNSLCQASYQANEQARCNIGILTKCFNKDIVNFHIDNPFGIFKFRFVPRAKAVRIEYF